MKIKNEKGNGVDRKDMVWTERIRSSFSGSLSLFHILKLECGHLELFNSIV